MKLAKTFIEVDTGSREPAEMTIKGYMPIGSVSGTGSVAVTAFEVLVQKRELAFHGVRFEISSGGDYPSEGIATVSADSAEKLMVALDQLANTQIVTSRFALSEVEAVVDDLRVVVFNTEQGRIFAAVEAGGATCHLMSLNVLLDLRKLVSLATEHLKEKGVVT